MKKTWAEKYEEWFRRSGFTRNSSTEYAYHAGRRHQKKALREQGRAWRERIDKLFKIIDNRNEEVQDLACERNEYRLECDVLIQEKKRIDENTNARQASQLQIMNAIAMDRNEYKAKCESLTQAVKRIDEKRMAQHIIYCQKIDECEALKHERSDIQIQNGSLKNQVRFLRETIVDLESKEPWWKFWKVDW